MMAPSTMQSWIHVVNVPPLCTIEAIVFYNRFLAMRGIVSKHSSFTIWFFAIRVTVND